MAEDTTKKRRLKKVESVRERASKTSSESAPRRISNTASKAGRPIKVAVQLGRKEYHPLKMPDNKVGRFLNRRARLTPRFLRESWSEVRQVTWPTARETVKLTTAVFLFAIIFGTVIAIVDYGLDKLFRSVILK